jgi:hypothetical protein
MHNLCSVYLLCYLCTLFVYIICYLCTLFVICVHYLCTFVICAHYLLFVHIICVHLLFVHIVICAHYLLFVNIICYLCTLFVICAHYLCTLFVICAHYLCTLYVICVVRLLFVLFSVLFVCKCVLPPGDNPTAVNKYIISSSISTCFGRLWAHNQEKQQCLCDTWYVLFCVDDCLVCRQNNKHQVSHKHSCLSF